MGSYTLLFNAISDALKEIEILREKLILAQQEAEERFIEEE